MTNTTRTLVVIAIAACVAPLVAHGPTGVRVAIAIVLVLAIADLAYAVGYARGRRG